MTWVINTFSGHCACISLWKVVAHCISQSNSSMSLKEVFQDISWIIHNVAVFWGKADVQNLINVANFSADVFLPILRFLRNLSLKVSIRLHQETAKGQVWFAHCAWLDLSTWHPSMMHVPLGLAIEYYVSQPLWLVHVLWKGGIVVH